LHRTELTTLERAEHIAKWIELRTPKVETDLPSWESSLSDGRKKGPQHQPSGINAASRDLGIERNEAQRSVKIDAITPAVLSRVALLRRN
jgi:hypothetical protein